MKKSFLTSILFCLLIIAAGCKTAPADKAPEPVPAETITETAPEKQPAPDAVLPAQTEESAQPAPSVPESAAPDTSRNKEAPKTAGGTAPVPARAKTAPDSPAAKTDQTRRTGKALTQPKKNAAPAANKTDTAKNTPNKKAAPQKTAPAKKDAVKAPAKTAQQKAAQAGTAKQETPKQKATRQKSAQKETAKQETSKQKNAPVKTAQTGQAKQEAAKQKAMKQEPAKQNLQKQATPADTSKKATAKTAAPKQDSSKKTKTAPAKPIKQPEKKSAEQKTTPASKSKPSDPKKTPAAPYTASAQITDVLWMIEQADASFVSKQHKGNGKMFVTMLAKYKGELTDKDFQEALFSSPIDMWLLDAESAKNIIEIDKKNKLMILKHLASGENEGAVALGKWFVSITLAGQKPFEKELNVIGIGGQEIPIAPDTGTAKTALKKKDVPLLVPVAKTANEQQALAFPVIQSVSRNADTIEIIFSIKDPRIKNAYFYFDVPGEEYYRDSGSMVDTAGKPVNGCRSFSTDGKSCRYILRKDAGNKDWFDKVIRCFLVVSDVNRITSPLSERHRTINAAAPITK